MYDLIFVGSGVSSCFALLPLINVNLKILVIEAGLAFEKRTSRLTTDSHAGFGGLGLSEGKYNFSADFGGDLAKKIGIATTNQHLTAVSTALAEFGAKDALSYQTLPPKKTCDTPLEFLSCTTKHLGTSLSKQVFANFAQFLAKKVAFCFETSVASCQKSGDGFLVTTDTKKQFAAKQVVLAVGQQKPAALQRIIVENQLTLEKSRVDLGFRIEMHKNALDSLLLDQKEVKMRLHDSYTYCMNKGGRVVKKRQFDRIMADGQNQREQGPSENLNFSLFQPFYFNSYQEQELFLKKLFKKINQDQEKIQACTLGDLLPQFKKKQAIKGTLPFEQADSAIILPTVLQRTQLFFQELEAVCGKDIDGQTLLYCYDTKHFQPKVATDRYFETSVHGLFLIGDCSGETYSLAQAAASGHYFGSYLETQLKN